MKVALYSGGKESVYAALKEWPVDLFLFLIYDFPRPSPHLLNLPVAVRLGSEMAPVVVKRLTKGREFQEKAELLKKLGAEVIVAGDVDVDEHLKYMEKLAGEVGAELREPLWGQDHLELLYKEVEELRFLVVGSRARNLLCVEVGRENVEEFVKLVREAGVDPLGEYGDYHSQVLEAPRLGARVEARCREVRDYGGYYVALL
ncbi:MAG: ATPase [Pyrobaculum sp.]